MVVGLFGVSGGWVDEGDCVRRRSGYHWFVSAPEGKPYQRDRSSAGRPVATGSAASSSRVGAEVHFADHVGVPALFAEDLGSRAVLRWEIVPLGLCSEGAMAA